ncbi:probable galacturonosyltransferase 7 isoform X4 [Mangifera indica]|uniref:probable galacturonosyltransferase 7 isoform X4 n=1 Tax=Mangifera indica TaxID=29780 RepID=UPI001CFB8264|nr:probable galacturonosyltransferase 7 isoform X4 [Mangifera indica]
MKGGGGGGGLSVTGKWRWRGLVIGVLFLVILSMLVHLAFLLGVRNGFHSPNPNGYVPVQHTSVSDVLRKSTAGTENQTTDRNVMQSGQHKEALPVEPHTVLPPPPNTIDTSYAAKIEGTDVKGGINENENCDLKFGSYCLWRKEHREDMKDSMVKKLKDQLFVARAYYPSIAKLPSQSRLTRELRQNIQELERVLSESATDANLPQEIGEKSQKTEAAIVRAKSFPVDCNNIDRKLRQIFDLTEGEASFHMKQNAFLYRLAVQTMPKSLHCLSMKLTVEYFKSPYLDLERSQADKYSDPLLHHYVIFSNNVLASSVVINSTVMHSKESESQVFHVLTDEQNYFAMKLWFFRNAFKEATVQVLNIEKFSLDYYDKATLSHLLLPVEFRVSFRNVDDSSTQERTQYLSVFSDVHYLLPEIFQSLEKVVVLDDDVVVQKDLSVLWNLDMGGKVNGAVQFCSVTLGLLKSYLGEKNFNKNSCAWMSGLNLVDLARWRELDLTKTYRKMAREQVSLEEESIEAAALPASLLTFQDLIYALDGVGALSGLGHDYGLDVQTIKQAAVLHYNGNMKPWLELGIPRYKQYWKKFLNPEDQFLSECNVHA